MKTKSLNKKTIIIIISAIIAAAAITAAVLLYFGAEKKKAKQEAAEAEFAARIDEELASMLTATFSDIDISPCEGSFTVTSLISGKTYEKTLSPKENKPLEVSEILNAIIFGRTPKEVSVSITHNGAEVFSGAYREYRKSFTPSDNETYGFTVSAVTENAAYSGTATYKFDVTYKIVPRFYLSSENINQGSTLVVCGENLPADTKVSVSVPFSFTPAVVRRGNNMYSIIPFNYKREAGENFVTVAYGDNEKLELSYTVTEMDFPADYEEQEITVSDETAAATINNSAAYAEYNNKVAELAKVFDEEVYWDSWFAMPCEGSVTSDYGYTRYLNGKAGSAHAGVDFACDEGTPVYASNAGRVIFSGELQMSGNTIVIEHGNGVQTKYLHMSSRDVKEGDMVEQLQQIGAVGMTGLATGPHLHFEVDISGSCVSPWPLLDGSSDLYKIESFQIS